MVCRLLGIKWVDQGIGLNNDQLVAVEVANKISFDVFADVIFDIFLR
jgi:hypothetical protein